LTIADRRLSHYVAILTDHSDRNQQNPIDSKLENEEVLFNSPLQRSCISKAIAIVTSLKPSFRLENRSPLPLFSIISSNTCKFPRITLVFGWSFQNFTFLLIHRLDLLQDILRYGMVGEILSILGFVSRSN
jgi:hypothetical protein